MEKVITINGINYDENSVVKALAKIKATEERKTQATEERKTNKMHKLTLLELFKNYDKMLCSLWYTLKNEDNETTRLIINNLSGVAGAAKMKIYQYIIAKYSKYVNNEGCPLRRYKVKETNEIFYRPINKDARTAITILRNACIHYIETLRKGSMWGQIIVNDNEIRYEDK